MQPRVPHEPRSIQSRHKRCARVWKRGIFHGTGIQSWRNRLVNRTTKRCPDQAQWRQQGSWKAMESQSGHWKRTLGNCQTRPALSSAPACWFNIYTRRHSHHSDLSTRLSCRCFRQKNPSQRNRSRTRGKWPSWSVRLSWYPSDSGRPRRTRDRRDSQQSWGRKIPPRFRNNRKGGA